MGQPYAAVISSRKAVISSRKAVISRRRAMLALLAALIIVALGAPPRASAFSQSFCGVLVDDNTWCWSPAPEHSFNFVSNTYPSASTL
jgi:hypothetical protein